MRYAISIYRGGELIDACAPNTSHQSSIDDGAVCPFCYESLVWVKGYTTGGSDKRRSTETRAAWRHRHQGVAEDRCEATSLSTEGRDMVASLSQDAISQRLSLFNSRFWDIFTYQKKMPTNRQLRKFRLHSLDVTRAHQLWQDTTLDTFLGVISDSGDALSSVSNRTGNPKREREIDLWQKVLRSPLWLKICTEVFFWLKSSSAEESFAKLLSLSVYDIQNISPMIGGAEASDKNIVFVTMTNLVMTDWERGVERYHPKKRKGFG